MNSGYRWKREVIIAVNFPIYAIGNWKPEKNSGFNGIRTRDLRVIRSEFSNLCDSNPWPPRYRCDALPTELWSHTLGARSIVGSHFPVRGVKRCKVYEIIHIWTADIDESENCVIIAAVNYFIYFNRFFTGKWEPTIDLAPNVWLQAQLVEHRTGNAEARVRNWSLNFFRLPISNCINWKIHCDDHFSLSKQVLSQIHKMTCDQASPLPNSIHFSLFFFTRFSKRTGQAYGRIKHNTKGVLPCGL